MEKPKRYRVKKIHEIDSETIGWHDVWLIADSVNETILETTFYDEATANQICEELNNETS